LWQCEMTSSIGPKHSGVPAPSATQRCEQLAPSRHARTGPLVFDELTSVAATSAKRAGPRPAGHGVSLHSVRGRRPSTDSAKMRSATVRPNLRPRRRYGPICGLFWHCVRVVEPIRCRFKGSRLCDRWRAQPAVSWEMSSRAVLNYRGAAGCRIEAAHL